MVMEIDGLARDFEGLLLDLFSGLKGLFLDELAERGVIFGCGYVAADNDYSPGLPSFDFDTKKAAFPPVTSIEEEAESDEGCNAAEQPMTHPKSNYSTYYGDITIRRVPRYSLGYRILGRAFPNLRRIEIASDLYGRDFDEVKAHELMHVRHPELSELEVRRITREILPFAPRFH
jgi:hypothetical protein